MPRARGYDAQERSKRLHVRLSDDEHAAVVRAAAKADLTPTGYAAEAAVLAATRGVGGGEPGAAREAAVQLMRARTALARVGTNLNQAVAKFNATGEVPPSLAPAVAAARRAIVAVEDATSEVTRAMRRGSGRSRGAATSGGCCATCSVPAVTTSTSTRTSWPGGIRTRPRWRR